MFVALDIVFTRFLSIQASQNLRFSFQTVALALSGWVLGPVWACVAAVAGDLLGMLINSGGVAIIPLLTLSAAAKGLIFGLVLYKRNITLWRTALAYACVAIVCDMGLTTLGLTLSFGGTYAARLWTRLPAIGIQFVVLTLLVTALFKALEPPLTKMLHENE